jgi:hypothetical protein
MIMSATPHQPLRALNIQSGEVLDSLHERHRALDSLQFLKRIEQTVPAEIGVRLVLDNASSRKTSKVKRWLAAHPRFVLHTSPDLRQLDQPRRAVVRRTDHEASAPRSTPLRPRAHHRHQQLGRHLERKPPPLRLDQNRRREHRLHQTLPPSLSTSGETLRIKEIAGHAGAEHERSPGCG